MQKGDRWPRRDINAFAYGADRPMSAICAAERTYKLLMDAQDGDGVDIELHARVISAIDMLCQRFFDEFNPGYFSQMVGLLRKFLKRVDERFIDPRAETDLPVSTSEDDPEGTWAFWLRGAREQFALAKHVLGMMRDHRLGSERVVINGRGFMVQLNNLVFEDNAQVMAAALSEHPGLMSWSYWQA